MQAFEISWILASDAAGKLCTIDGSPGESLRMAVGMCRAPGAPDNVEKLESDVSSLAGQGVKSIVCLLSDHDFEAYKLSKSAYKTAAEKCGIHLLFYPIEDFGIPPQHPSQLQKELVQKILALTPLAIHCKAGIGRSGTIACCLLLETGLFGDVEESVKYIRKYRNPKCVETEEQLAYVRRYFSLLSEATHPS